MTKPSVTSRRDSTAGQVNGSAVSARVPLIKRTRRPAYIGLLVVLVLGMAALGGYLYSTAGSKYQVVVVATDIAVGQTIERSDLSIAEVAGEVSAVAAERIDTVIGQRAAVGLVPGTLVQRAMLTAGPVLADGQAQVGVAVAIGQLPADGLLPGDIVTVLRLPSQQDNNVGGDRVVPSLIAEGAVVITAVQQGGQAAGWTVTLQVPVEVAPAVAGASGAGLASLVRVAS